jgi:chromosome condensin MukBEF ATPase and DNA-binding subunit MukB
MLTAKQLDSIQKEFDEIDKAWQINEKLVPKDNKSVYEVSHALARSLIFAYKSHHKLLAEEPTTKPPVKPRAQPAAQQKQKQKQQEQQIRQLKIKPLRDPNTGQFIARSNK